MAHKGWCVVKNQTNKQTNKQTNMYWKNRSYVYESTYITEFIKQVKEKRSNVNNVLVNIKLCRCMKKISSTLAYAEIELKNQRKPLSEHAQRI